MNFLQDINNSRRTLLRGITKHVGRVIIVPQTFSNVRTEVKRVLICRPNHRLGNLLLITPLLQEVTSTFPESKIDLFVKGTLAPILFKNYQNIDCIIELPKAPFQYLLKYIQTWISIRKKHYDIVINVDGGSSSGRLSVQFANSRYKLFGDPDSGLQQKFKDYEHFAKNPVYTFRYNLSKLGLPPTKKPMPSLDLKLSSDEIDKGKNILKQLVHNDNQTICLFTYATGDKCYPASWWEEFYKRLRTEYPQLNIIEVLPIQNISKLSFRVPSYYSRDIRQLGSVIANTQVFIGADSGIMHLASAVKTPTVGLFSITNKHQYGPYGNSSASIDTNTDNIETCIHLVNRILDSQLVFES
jgi:ADP-heptose:LPS heptosyltransferase